MIPGFTLPESYRSLRASGFISPGDLASGDVIWTEVQSYDAFLAEHRPPGWKECPEELVIFAESHGGEGWMWDSRSHTASDEYPIINTEFYMHAPNSPNRFERALYAPTFPVFLFLCILEDARDISGFEEIEEIRTACAALLTVADPSLTEEISAITAHFAGIQPTDDLCDINIDSDLAGRIGRRAAGERMATAYKRPIDASADYPVLLATRSEPALIVTVPLPLLLLA